MNRCFVYGLFVLLLTSCVTSRQVNYMQDIKGMEVSLDSLSNSEYVVQVGDVLSLTVLSPDETANKLFPINQAGRNSGLYSYNVYEDGCIDLPFVGSLEVRGRQLREVRDSIEQRLLSLFSPVSVNVNVVNKTFSVIGESGAGRYTMPREKITIFQALALAGDLSTYADRKNLKLIRQDELGETKVYSIDVRDKDIVNSPYYYVCPNDVIYVPYLVQKTFGITHFTAVLSTTLSTISLVTTLVNLGVLIAR